MSALNQIDFYKADHRSQYPDGTSLVFSNWTPRSSRRDDIDEVVAFGLQYYLKKFLINEFDNFFFGNKDFEVREYARRMETSGINITYEHIEALWDLGYLPIEIWALPEGTSTPLGVPQLVMWNTHPEFFWLTNYLETSLSATLWGPCTSATIAKKYRQIFMAYARVTGGSEEFVDFQGHDFSMRGMYGMEAAAMSGAGHLLSFNGTDTIPSIDFLEKYYGGKGEFIGGSVPATEHSVMCMGGEESEFDTYKRLITEVYPSGIVSIVSDTWDYWEVVTDIIPRLKSEIMAREGTVTIRPDSGDPVLILCGDPDAPEGSPEYKGTIECLWDTFGGTVNERGYKQLDSHINAIYGDSITIERADDICWRLMMKGFVPSMVLGIGSYTYQYQTRDTFGFAMKATYGEVNGEPREIFKDPKTDKGGKKSAKGLLAVYRGSDMGRFDAMNQLHLVEQATWEEVKNCAFEIKFKDGVLYNEDTLADIRKRVRG